MCQNCNNSSCFGCSYTYQNYPCPQFPLPPGPVGPTGPTGPQGPYYPPLAVRIENTATGQYYLDFRVDGTNTVDSKPNTTGGVGAITYLWDFVTAPAAHSNFTILSGQGTFAVRVDNTGSDLSFSCMLRCRLEDSLGQVAFAYYQMYTVLGP